MKILIPLKQVPDSTVRVKVAPDGTSVVTEGITWSISPYDEYAIEMALERKDADPSTVVAVVTVGPALAELLGWPHVATITKVAPAEGGVELWREVEGGHEVWKAPLPALATVHKSEKEPRYPSLPGIMKAKKKDIPERALDALGVDTAAPTWTVLSMEPPPARGGGKILKDGDAKQIAERLATALRDEAKVL